MDPLSISFGAVSVLTLCCRLLSICKLVSNARHVDAAVNEWKTVLEVLVNVLGKVEEKFKPVEETRDEDLRGYYGQIQPILTSCGTTIYGLLENLPKRNDSPNLLNQTYDLLRVEIAKDSTKTKLSYIQTYVHCLGTLLSAEVAGSQWQIQASQSEIERAIRVLSDNVNEVKTSLETVVRRPLPSTLEPETEACSSDNATVAKDSALDDIRNYIASTSLLAERLASGSMCSSAAVTVTSVISVDASDDHSPEYDPGFALYHYPPKEILESQIKNYEGCIEQFRRVRLFDKALDDIKQLILLKSKLEEHYLIPFDDRREVETTRAKISYEKATVPSLKEAKDECQRLLKESKEGLERYTLCFFLAAIYVKQGRFDEAKPYAETAMNRLKAVGAAEEMLRDLYLLLEQIHQRLREYPAAKTYREILETQYRHMAPIERQRTTSIVNSPPVSISGPPTESNDASPNIHDWLEKHGFEKRGQFPFGEPHPRTGKLPLHVAIELKNKEIVHALMYHGVNLESKDQHGATALLQAASTQVFDIVRMILNHVANEDNPVDVNATDNFGNNALHRVARRKEDARCAELLLDVRPAIDINYKNAQGRTPLHEAVGKGNTELVSILLNQAPLELNTCDNAMDTACHIAVREHREEILCLLLNAGASVILPNGEGNDLEKAIKVAWKMEPTVVNQVKSMKQQQTLALRNGSIVPVGTVPTTSLARSDTNISRATGETHVVSSPQVSQSRWHGFRWLSGR